MLDSSGLLLLLAHRIPALFDGAGLHRAALAEMNHGRFERAEDLFEIAARRYRDEVEVEALARLRVHQLMAKVRSGALGEAEAGKLVLEVDRRLARLDRIESLDAPFRLMDARALLASWLPAADAGSLAA